MSSMNAVDKSASLRIPVRVGGSGTSISLRKHIVALWILLGDINVDEFGSKLNDFIYSCLDTWEGDSAKGFSEYISEKLIETILEDEDFREFKRILLKI